MTCGPVALSLRVCDLKGNKPGALKTRVAVFCDLISKADVASQLLCLPGHSKQARYNMEGPATGMTSRKQAHWDVSEAAGPGVKGGEVPLSLLWRVQRTQCSWSPGGLQKSKVREQSCSIRGGSSC